MEQVESTIASIVCAGRPRNFLQLFDAIAGIIDGRNKSELTTVGISQEVCEIWKTVDRFLDRREFSGLGPIAVYHLAVVFKKRDVVGGRFNT